MPSPQPVPASVRDVTVVLTPLTMPGPPSTNVTFTTGWANTCWVCGGWPRRSQRASQ